MVAVCLLCFTGVCVCVSVGRIVRKDGEGRVSDHTVSTDAAGVRTLSL